MSKPRSRLRQCPKESFSNDENNDLVDDCDRMISHIAPQVMQTKCGCVANVIMNDIFYEVAFDGAKARG